MYLIELFYLFGALLIIIGGLLFLGGVLRIVIILAGIVLFGLAAYRIVGPRVGQSPAARAGEIQSRGANGDAQNHASFDIEGRHLPAQSTGEMTLSMIVDFHQIKYRAGLENNIIILTSNIDELNGQQGATDNEIVERAGGNRTAASARNEVVRASPNCFLSIVQDPTKQNSLRIQQNTKRYRTDASWIASQQTVPNVPVHRPFLLTLVFSQQFMTSYVDCELRETRRVNFIRMPRTPPIYGVVGYNGGFIGRIQRVKLTAAPWTADNVAAECRTVPAREGDVARSDNEVYNNCVSLDSQFHATPDNVLTRAAQVASGSGGSETCPA